ncbi:hypothetical protein DYBT9623_05264 [Dyadobacter sp. CECT 9623]|uniref:Uncharacterized protein n=1 Tax=Dyadobacter linearis TaxID=2823330 RepID=A0ABN7REL0_9BACT|nr:hypothetical protein DYBT9623_05264 [Dyadobacter sp. CECT 9623]
MIPNRATVAAIFRPFVTRTAISKQLGIAYGTVYNYVGKLKT